MCLFTLARREGKRKYEKVERGHVLLYHGAINEITTTVNIECEYLFDVLVVQGTIRSTCHAYVLLCRSRDCISSSRRKPRRSSQKYSSLVERSKVAPSNDMQYSNGLFRPTGAERVRIAQCTTGRNMLPCKEPWRGSVLLRAVYSSVACRADTAP